MNKKNLSTKIIINIILTKACRQHGFPFSLAICSYQSSLLVSLFDGIQCPHSADESKSLLVGQKLVCLCVGERHL